MAIKFCDECSATIFSRKQIKKIASENGMIAKKDFFKVRVDGGWKAFCIIETEPSNWWERKGTTQTLFWCT